MGDTDYRPVIDEMVWSYSRIKTFSDCPYRWYMTYLMNLKGADLFYASYGTFMHSLLAEYYTGKTDKDGLLAKFLANFSQEVRGERPKAETVRKYIRSGIDYFEHFKPFPYKTAAVEREVRFDISGVRFVGFIDYLGESDDGYVIADHKSRELKPRGNPEKPRASDAELDLMLRQLYLYSAAVQQIYGKLPVKLCFNCFRSGLLIEEPFCEDAYKATLDWAVTEIEKIKSTDEFSPKYSYFQCRYLCEMRDQCCYYQLMNR